MTNDNECLGVGMELLRLTGEADEVSCDAFYLIHINQDVCTPRTDIGMKFTNGDKGDVVTVLPNG